MDSTTTEKHKSRHRADSDDDHKSKKRRKDKEHRKDDEREHRKDRDRKDKDREHKKDRDREHKKDKHRKHKSKSKDQGISVVDDDGEEDMWVEKNIDGEGSAAVVSGIPTAESLGLNSNPSYVPDGAKEPPSNAQTTQTKLQRDEWMLLDPSTPTVPIGTPSRPPDRAVLQTADEMTDGFGEEVRNMRTLGGGVDFFSSLGTEHRKKPPPKDPNEKPKISAREMNRGEPEPESTTNKGPPAPGAPGSQWRMLKLKRTYQEAEEDGRPLEDIVRDRWDSWEHWEAALAERKWMDERAPSQSQSQRSGPPQRGGGGGGERYMFNTPPADLSRSSSRNSFRKPGESTPTTPGAGPGTGANATQAFKGRVDALKGAPKPTLGEVKSGLQSAGPSTPIPTVLAPNLPPQGKKKRGLSPSELNKLQAKVLRAKLMGGEDADRLQAEYDEAVRVANGGDGSDGDEEETRVEAVPTMDGHGRLYDIGTGKGDQGPPVLPGNRRKNQDNFETRDPKTGELLRINADDDTQTLADLLREERLGGGPSDQKNLDAALAGAIARDGKYEDDLEYVDDNAERLARRKMKSDAMKRQFAIQDYARTQKVLSSCVYCPGNDKDEMAPPRAGVIAMGTRAYLAVTPNEELVPGHCQIVPLQHMLSMLEGDDDVWDEVKNFMKCLMRTFAEEDKGVVFYETVMSLRQQRHTVIECVPVPREQFTELPAYFRESILMSESEWSQHKKLIDFSKRPGGFRRSMVPNLPYFMVQWDYKGEQGYGHVIEGQDMADDPDGDVDEGDKGGGQFPRWFAAEIIGNILDVEPRRWRRPRKEDFRMNDRRVEVSKKKFDKYDWTKMLAQSS